jgi:hypothetical protein
MSENMDILETLVVRLRSSMQKSGALQVIEKKNDSIVLQVGANSEAIIGLRVSDPNRPSFHVSYPQMKIKKSGDRHIKETDSSNVLVGGVEWIINQLAEHGVVMPEFID